jgi:hypothetical protein
MVNSLLIPQALNGATAIRRARHRGEGLALVRARIQKLAIAVVTLAAAASLAGCGTSPRPLSYEEEVWFDNATGYEFIPVRPYPAYWGGPRPYAPYPPVRYRG